MDCTSCKLKGCRKLSPCVDKSEKYISSYKTIENTKYIRAASKLIDNSRAGTLTRLEEIVEYVKFQGYTKIGVAYCYGLEKEAVLLKQYLKSRGINPVMVSCTVDGISEARIDENKTSQVVSCNPIGQANVLNESNVEFTLLMGLCLGHDILIQKNLKMDFTTFVVKDRVLNHNPLLALTKENQT